MYLKKINNAFIMAIIGAFIAIHPMQKPQTNPEIKSSHRVINPFQIIQDDNDFALNYLLSGSINILKIKEISSDFQDLPLHYAIRHKRMRCFRVITQKQDPEYLKKLKKVVQAKNKSGQSALALAEESDNSEISTWAKEISGNKNNKKKN